jgi:two-component system cell cycle sensor histidine kinase/response regulator CckA
LAIPEDLWAVEADEGQINQVINNLVINADQAMPNGGIIEVKARNVVFNKPDVLPLPEGEYIEIAIKDRGIGIPEGNKSRLFEPYFTTKQKGSGLGLATSYSIVKSHGGYIKFESELGIGTTFHLYLPATRQKVEKGQEQISPPLPKAQGRILVMDDESTIRMLLGRILKGAGYEVELTEDGVKAIQKYIEAKESGKPFNAVILDLTIPGGMGGKEVITRLLEIDPGVKAIVSSGYSMDPIMTDYNKYGFSAVVSKPYNIKEMLQTLNSLFAPP